jgi:hypothetical protein
MEETLNMSPLGETQGEEKVIESSGVEETGSGEHPGYNKEDFSFKKRTQDFLAAFTRLTDEYGVTIQPAIGFVDLLATGPAVGGVPNAE